MTTIGSICGLAAIVIWTVSLGILIWAVHTAKPDPYEPQLTDEEIAAFQRRFEEYYQGKR